MASIGHEWVATQVGGKQLFAEGHRLVGAQRIQAVGRPDVLGRFDDEGGGLFVKLVDVGLEPAVFGLLENEVEGVELLVGTKPDKTVGPCHHIGLEHIGVQVTNAGVDAVAGDHQVGIGEVGVGHHVLLEHQLDTQLFTARLQDVEQLLAANPHKAVAAAADGAALETQLDVVPVVEGLLDGGGGGRVPLAHVLHGGIREHHAPAEGVVGLVALDHRDVVCRVLHFHQQAEIQARWPTPDTDDLHADSSRAMVEICMKFKYQYFISKVFIFQGIPVGNSHHIRTFPHQRGMRGCNFQADLHQLRARAPARHAGTKTGSKRVVQAVAMAASSTSTQCLTGVPVPLCRWVMQPMLADTMVCGCSACRWPSLRSRKG